MSNRVVWGAKVIFGSTVIKQFRTQKTAALLAYLALHPGHHNREALIELLWPESTLEAGRNSLNVSLNSLRSLFDSLHSNNTSPLENPAKTPTAQAFLIADRHTIEVNQDCVIVDTHQFERRLQTAALSDESPGSLVVLSNALDAYDRLLPGFYEDWILREAQRLETLFFAALQKFLIRSRKLGDTQLALIYARRGLTFDPTREEIQRDVMHLLLDTGQVTAAYHQYKTLEDLLHKRYGVIPDPTTRQLGRQIEGAIRKDAICNNAVEERNEPVLLDSSLKAELPSKTAALTLAGQVYANYSPDRATEPPESCSIEDQVQALVMAYFDNISQRRAYDNLTFFLRPDITVTGVSESGGVDIIWHHTANVHLDVLQRELTNLAVDTPVLVDAMQIQSIGVLTVARVFVVNKWVYCQYVITITTEGGTPKITSITLASCPPMRFSSTDPFVRVGQFE